MTADPRYPIGKFAYDGVTTPDARARRIQEIAEAPAGLRAAVRDLTLKQMDMPYREGGWTVRQLVHHVPDSHLNAYVRFKLALTEDTPTIKPYDQERWAQLADTKTVAPGVSLALLDAVHERWVTVLKSMTAADWRRAYHHPEYNRRVPLDEVLAMYAWHGRHHVAHITSLREREGWT
jgi:uncharacterized damage-inducible protein DinB